MTVRDSRFGWPDAVIAAILLALGVGSLMILF